MQQHSRRRLLTVCIMAVNEAIADQQQVANDNAQNAPEFSQDAAALAQQWRDLIPTLSQLALSAREPLREKALKALGDARYHHLVVALRYALTAARSRILALEGGAQRDARRDYTAYDRVLTHLKGHLADPSPQATQTDPRDVIKDIATRGELVPHPDGGWVHRPKLPD